MHGVLKLLTNHLFIIKALQRSRLRRSRSVLRGSLLDMGCGTGPYKHELQCARYVGIDETEAVHPDLCARTEKLAFKDRSFDSVLCTELLEHLKEPQEALKETYRILKQGGFMYITVPQSWGLHYCPHDYWRFTRYGIVYLLEQAGFSVVSVERIGGVFSLIGARLADVIWTVLAGCLRFFGKRWAERIATLLCLPGSLIFYLLALLLDRIDQQDALGWALLAQKK